MHRLRDKQPALTSSVQSRLFHEHRMLQECMHIQYFTSNDKVCNTTVFSKQKRACDRLEPAEKKKGSAGYYRYGLEEKATTTNKKIKSFGNHCSRSINVFRYI